MAETPAFVDVGVGDHRFPLESPCIDAGLSEASEGNVDIEGGLRFVGPAVDMGAFEAQP